MRFLITVFALLSLAIPPRAAADDIPVAPLPRITLDPWGEVFRLTNPHLDLVIHPDSDGIVSLRFPLGPNLLAAPATLLPAPAGVLTDALPRLDGIPQPRWQSRAWITSEGGQSVLMTQTFGAPLHLRITHLFSLPRDTPTLHWSTRITAVAPTPLPTDTTAIFPTTFPPAPDLTLTSTWHLENGPELPGTGQVTNTPGGTTYSFTLSPDNPPPDLPPQGWTLLHDLTLLLTPASDPAPELPPTP